MDEVTVTPKQCDCLNKLDAAAEDCRSEARSNPRLAAGYYQAALGISRVAQKHFKACSTCQIAEARAERAA
jgi:hypothetical protein